jgi:hypothetical protein
VGGEPGAPEHVEDADQLDGQNTPNGSHAKAIIGNMIVTLETRVGYVPRLSLHEDFLGSNEQNFARPTIRFANAVRSMEFHPGETG